MTLKLYFLLATLASVTASEFARQKYGAEFVKSRFESRNRITPRNFRLSRFQSVEDVYNVYDATFLAYVWPKLKNGAHLTVDPACWDDMNVFSKDLIDGRMWAYTAVDASGRYESGLLEGNHYWLGSKKQCLKLDNEYSARGYNESFTYTISERFDNIAHMAYLRERLFDASPEGEWQALQADPSEQETIPPFRMSYSSVKLVLNITKPTFMSHELILGVCLPRSCSSDDVHSIIEFSVMINDHLKSNKTLPRNVKVTSARTIYDSYNMAYDPTALLLVILTAVLVILTIVATATDLGLLKFTPRNCKTMSFDLNTPEANNNFNKSDRSINDLPMPKFDIPIHRKHHGLVLPSKVVDMETLTINNLNSENLVKALNPEALPPSITLDVIGADDTKRDSCNRCGKYKKQCVNLRKVENLPPCPRTKSNNSFASFNSEKSKKSDFCKNLLLCFSIRQSWQRLCNTSIANRDLSAVHVLKIFATFWVVYVHVALVVSTVADNSGDVKNNDVLYETFMEGTLAFDILFFISGVLSAHHFFYLKSRYTVEELVSFGGAFGHAMQFVCFVTNRAVRLLPPYIFTILLSSVLARVTLQTSPLELPERDYENCDLYCWRNILYINVFYSSDTRCMLISWYLSLESLLHCAATLLQCGVSRGAGLCAAACSALAALAADAVLPRAHVLPTPFAAYTLLVDRPWSRVAPYFLGTWTGWRIRRADGQCSVSSLKRICLWSVSAWSVSASLLAPLAVRGVGAAADAVASSAAHALCAAAFIWPAIACATCYSEVIRRALDNRFVSCLSRLSYGVLLLHGTVARYLIVTDSVLSADYMWCYYSGVCAASVAASLWLSLLVETPCATLLRRLSDCASS